MFILLLMKAELKGPESYYIRYSFSLSHSHFPLVCVFCFFSFVIEIKRGTSTSHSGAHYGQWTHHNQRIFFPTNLILSHHRTKAGGSNLYIYSLMQGSCPLLTHCLISHQRSICKLKDLYSVKYFTCHQPGAPGSLDVVSSRKAP